MFTRCSAATVWNMPTDAREHGPAEWECQQPIPFSRRRNRRRSRSSCSGSRCIGSCRSANRWDRGSRQPLCTIPRWICVASVARSVHWLCPYPMAFCRSLASKRTLETRRRSTSIFSADCRSWAALGPPARRTVAACPCPATIQVYGPARICCSCIHIASCPDLWAYMVFSLLPRGPRDFRAALPALFRFRKIFLRTAGSTPASRPATCSWFRRIFLARLVFTHIVLSHGSVVRCSSNLDPEFVFKFPRLFNHAPSSVLDVPRSPCLFTLNRVVPRVLSHFPIPRKLELEASRGRLR